MEDLWHEEARINTLLNKRGKLMTSRSVIKSAASAAKKLSAAHGLLSTNQIRVAARRAGEVAVKSEVNQVPVKVEEKVAGNKALIIAKSIASTAD